MKKTVTISTLLAFVLLIAAQPALAGRIGKRQVTQDKRIFQGVKSGELTRKEARCLVRQQNRVQQSKRQAWSDETLTRKERSRLERQQDKASANIYRLKHNGWDRI